MEIINNKGAGKNAITARVCGLRVAGNPYYAVKADGRSFYCTQGQEGVVVVTTGKATIITHFPQTSTLGQAARCVEQLGDYLISAGQ